MDFQLLREPLEVEQNLGMNADGIEKAPLTTSKLLYCEDARRFLEIFGETVQELVKLHEQQFLSIVDCDSDAGRFDLLIHYANEKKLNAKYADLHHVETHGWSQTDETD
jgi:hypothetical protein